MTEDSVSDATITVIALSDMKQEDEKEVKEEPISVFGEWEEWPNDQGVSYFFNKETGESQWEDPRKSPGAAAASALFEPPKFEVKEEFKEDEQKTDDKRFLVRDASKHKWELDDIESMKNDMLAQMRMLQDETVKSGARMPTLRKKYRPARAPPTNPNPGLSKRSSNSVKSLPPIPSMALPSIPKSLPPTAPPRNSMDNPSSLSLRSLSMAEMNRAKTAEVPSRGRKKKRGSERSVQSEYLTTGSVITLYEAVSAFSPDDATKVELKVGDKIIVQKKKASGWWYGKNQESGKSGFFPASYVQKCQAERISIRRSKSQEVVDRKGSVWSGKMMHERSKRRSTRARLAGVANIRRRRNTRMGE